jgi:carboxyl-terminal processing protease
MIKKSKKIILTGVLSTLTAAYLLGSFAQAKSPSVESTAKEKLEAYIKFTQILNVIEKEYVDEVNTTALVDKALKGLMTNLRSPSLLL